MFALGAFVIASVAQEFCARRPRPPGDDPRPGAAWRSCSLIRRNRRRYGGYIVHAGLAVLLIGVAASSSFQHSQRRRCSSRGSGASVDGYTIRYVRADRLGAAAEDLVRRRARRHQGRQARDDAARRRAASIRRRIRSLGLIGRFFDTAPARTARSACDAGLRKDIWTVINARLRRRCRSLINKGDACSLPTRAMMTKAREAAGGSAQAAAERAVCRARPGDRPSSRAAVRHAPMATSSC